MNKLNVQFRPSLFNKKYEPKNERMNKLNVQFGPSIFKK